MIDSVFKVACLLQVLAEFTSQTSVNFGRPAIEIVTSSDDNGKLLESAFLHEINKAKKESVFYQTNTKQFGAGDNFNLQMSMCQCVTSRVLTRLGSHDMSTIDVIRSFSSATRVPFVTTGIALNTSGQELGYTICMRPLYAKAVADVVMHFRWTELVYIYNSAEGLQRWQQLIDAFMEHGYFVKTNLEFVHDSREALNKLGSLTFQGFQVKHILLDLPKESSQILQAQFNRKIGLNHDYVIIELSPQMEAGISQTGGIHVIAFHLTDYEGNLATHPADAALASDAVKAVTRGLRRAMSESPMLLNYTLQDDSEMEKLDCFNESIQPFPYGRQLLVAIKEVEFEGDSGKVKFNKFGIRSDHQLNVFETTKSSGLNKIGLWHSESGLNVKRSDLPEWKSDRPLVITSVLTEPFLMVKDGGNQTGANVRFEGYMVDLIEKVSQIVGFSYEIVSVKDGKYGQKDPETGAWNGMIGEVLREEVDFAAGPLTITSEREKVVDFTGPFLTTGISIIMKRPQVESSNHLFFLKYFSWGLWISLLFACFGAFVVHFIAFTLSRIRCNSEDSSVSAGVSWIGECLCFCCFPRSHRRQQKGPQSLAARIAVLSWWIFTVFMICVYTSQVIRVTANERDVREIQSAEDLAQQKGVKYGTIESSSSLAFFKASTVPTYERMFRFMMNTGPSLLVRSTDEGMTRVRTSNYALITDSLTIDYINSHPPCDTIKVGENLDTKRYGFATKQGSLLRDSLDLALKELNEMGVLMQLKHKWFDEDNCLPIARNRSKWNFQKFSIFLFLAGALCLALLILLCERLKTIWNKKREEKKERNVPDVKPQDSKKIEEEPGEKELRVVEEISTQL